MAEFFSFLQQKEFIYTLHKCYIKHDYFIQLLHILFIFLILPLSAQSPSYGLAITFNCAFNFAKNSFNLTCILVKENRNMLLFSLFSIKAYLIMLVVKLFNRDILFDFESGIGGDKSFSNFSWQQLWPFMLSPNYHPTLGWEYQKETHLTSLYFLAGMYSRNVR